MKIITDESKLRVDCESVQKEEIQEYRSILESSLKESSIPGVGLSLPQIGIAKKMAIVRVDDIKIDLVNCEIIKSYEPFYFEKEGCLSFPDMYKRTHRFNQILVVNNEAEPNRFIATGLISVIIQHEINHWYKILLPDLSEEYLENKA